MLDVKSTTHVCLLQTPYGSASIGGNLITGSDEATSSRFISCSSHGSGSGSATGAATAIAVNAARMRIAEEKILWVNIFSAS